MVLHSIDEPIIERQCPRLRLLLAPLDFIEIMDRRSASNNQNIILSPVREATHRLRAAPEREGTDLPTR